MRFESAGPGDGGDGHGESPLLVAGGFGALEGSALVGADGVLLVLDLDTVEVGEGVDVAAGEAFLEGTGDGELDVGVGAPAAGGGDLNILEESVGAGADGELGSSGGDEEGRNDDGEGDDADERDDAHFFFFWFDWLKVTRKKKDHCFGNKQTTKKKTLQSFNV